MDTKQFHFRVWIMMLVLSLMVTVMGATLYDLQINNGAAYYQKTQNTIPDTQTMESARGNLYDRNGQVLVSNQVIYQVTLDTSLMGTEEERNRILFALIQAARAEEVAWTDTLPITKEAPFAFTTDTPYFFTDADEEGNSFRSLTRLGKLSVRLGLIQDPTLEPEPETEAPAPREPGLLDKIKGFFKGGVQAPPAPAEPEEPQPLPTATQILGKLCRLWSIEGEGAVDEKAANAAGETVPDLNLGDLSPTDARAVAGVLYELYLRTTGAYAATEYVFASDVQIGFISRVKELSLPGVVVEAVTVRQYHTQYAAHLLGRVTSIYAEDLEYYTNLDLDGDGEGDYSMNDKVGRGGAEQAFEVYLRGKPGIRTVERNGKGKIVSEEWITEPEPGGNVFLTLDIGLQAYVENLFASVMPQRQELGAEGAACVVLDVKTAEVLAAATYPTFDLSNYAAELEAKAKDPLTPFVNRAFQGVYPPGSTFKMVTAIAGLEEEDIITPTTLIRDEGRYTYYTPDGPMCWIYRQFGSKHGLINVSTAIEVSCNYFFFEVGRLLGIQRLDEYAALFGLGERTGIELEESRGVMASPEYTESHGQTWYDGNTLSVAIGQESSQFTPLQLANYIATLVNGGTRHAAHLLKEVKSSDFSQVVYSYEPQVLGTIDIQDANLEAVKAGMLALTVQGSVRAAFADLPFQVGAKTGTAQTGSVSSDAHSVFVCFAPYDEPEIAVAMVVEHGEGGGDLSQMCADVLSYYFSSKETREEIPAENSLIR